MSTVTQVKTERKVCCSVLTANWLRKPLCLSGGRFKFKNSKFLNFNFQFLNQMFVLNVNLALILKFQFLVFNFLISISIP